MYIYIYIYIFISRQTKAGVTGGDYLLDVAESLDDVGFEPLRVRFNLVQA